MSNGKDRVEIMNHQERLAMFQRLETGAVTDAMVQLGVGSWMEGVYPTSPKMKVFGRVSWRAAGSGRAGIKGSADGEGRLKWIPIGSC